MNGKFTLFKEVLKITAIALVLSLCLFADSHVFETHGMISFILHELTGILINPLTQWMIILCVIVYLLTFILLQQRINGLRFCRAANPNFWLTGLLFLGALDYTFNYYTAAQSAMSLMLLTGVALNLGMSVTLLKQSRDDARYLTCLIESILVLLLLISSLWSTSDSGSHYFEYRGHTRWSGLWDNPNIYALLMGSGFLLALGLAVRIWKSGDKKSKMGDRSSKFGVNKYVIVILPLLAASLMARALMHSYSRGAWLAAFCGLVYLVFQTKKDLNCLQNHILRWVRTHGTSAIIIVCAITVFIFWQCQQQQHLIAKRAASIVNMNDFSWRNRVFAWKGALQIIAEHPWFGTGWGQAKLMYEHYYLPSKLNEAAAIAMNDYLMLGATLGIPALFCLGMYLWLSLTQKARIGNGESLSKEADWHQTACRASAIVLLIGFWFDGGLFILPTAAIFWIVMGLGSTKLSAVEDTVSQSG